MHYAELTILDGRQHDDLAERVVRQTRDGLRLAAWAAEDELVPTDKPLARPEKLAAVLGGVPELLKESNDRRFPVEIADRKT